MGKKGPQEKTRHGQGLQTCVLGQPSEKSHKDVELQKPSSLRRFSCLAITFSS